MTSIQQRAALQSQIWKIANDVQLLEMAQKQAQTRGQ
jgi:hypothetical protein